MLDDVSLLYRWKSPSVNPYSCGALVERDLMLRKKPTLSICERKHCVQEKNCLDFSRAFWTSSRSIRDFRMAFYGVNGYRRV